MTSQAGVNLVARFEGLRLTAYKPVASERYWTIGYGHYGPDVRAGQKITHARALELLRGDLRQAESAVDQLVRARLTQPQFDALASFTFNVGTGAFRHSTLLAKLNRRDYESVPTELLRWINPPAAREGLLRRRRAEGALFSQRATSKRDRWVRSLQIARARSKRVGWPLWLRQRARKLKRLIAR